MMRFTLLFTLLLSTCTVFSQTWLEIGGKAMYGLTGFYNTNLVNDREHSYQMQSGLAYGGVVSINFADRHGINVEGLLSENKQQFTLLTPKTITNVEWDNLDLYLLYRAYSGGGFFEIGPKISMVNSVSQGVDGMLEEVTTSYNDQYYSAAFGFGGFIAGSSFFTVKLGARFEYALSDFISDNGQDNNMPVVYKNYESYKATHPFRASIGLAINFAVGGTGKAQCGRRSFMFGSGYR